MKVERFIREYASHKRRMISGMECLTDTEKRIRFYEIDRAVRNRERGHITVDEAVRLIANVGLE